MYYPRSFLKFILLGFLLVSLPLVYALAELILSLDRLQSQAQQAVTQAAEAGRASRQFYEHSVTLERIVRQYLILDDGALLEDYAPHPPGIPPAARALSQLPLEPAQAATLGRTDGRARAGCPNGWRRAARSETRTAACRRFRAPRRRRAVAASPPAPLTDRATESCKTAAAGRQKWIWLVFATAGIALALAILFAVLIARPIRQLDQAIRQLGTADFTHAIEVDGPQDLRYLGQRLEWLRARLSDLEQQQNRFLRHVSHELKTPLTAVREGAELLRDNVGGTLSQQQKDIVRIVRENTLSLQKLIEDLLRYHQTRAVEPATVGPVHLPDVVRRVLREHKLAAFARMITFDAKLEPALVTGDAEKLRTVVDNLVSNAVKYSPRSGVIRLDLATADGIALLDVSDQGHGVDPAERERIFDSFYQGQAPVQGRVKGSGLGLAIAREYALAHGGRIEVGDRRRRQARARFRLMLPLALGDATISPTSQGAVTVSGAPPRRRDVTTATGTS